MLFNVCFFFHKVKQESRSFLVIPHFVLGNAVIGLEFYLLKMLASISRKTVRSTAK